MKDGVPLWLIVDFTWSGANRGLLLVSAHNPTSEMIFLLSFECVKGGSRIYYLVRSRQERGWDIPAQQSQASYCHGLNEIYHLLFMER